MKVLVTGGTGFVGSHSVAALLSQGHQVRLLVRSRDIEFANSEITVRGGLPWVDVRDVARVHAAVMAPGLVPPAAS